MSERTKVSFSVVMSCKNEGRGKCWYMPEGKGPTREAALEDARRLIAEHHNGHCPEEITQHV